jgi:hypothetical protein
MDPVSNIVLTLLVICLWSVLVPPPIALWLVAWLQELKKPKLALILLLAHLAAFGWGWFAFAPSRMFGGPMPQDVDGRGMGIGLALCEMVWYGMTAMEIIGLVALAVYAARGVGSTSTSE